MNPTTDLARSADLPPAPLPDPDARWALFLDVDGTLIDFADDPAAVAVAPALLDHLHQLHNALDGALALVSGRGIGELDRLFAQPAWAMAGLHGLQLRHASGERDEQATDIRVRNQLDRGARAIVERLDGVFLEDKGAAMALHCRPAPHQLEPLRIAAAELADRLEGYELQPGNLVMEIKPAGMDKGKAVAQLLQTAPFANRLPVYVGDDLTDEHGFAAVTAAGGFGIRVGSRTPSAARFTLADVHAVHAWLDQLLQNLTA